MSLVPELNTLNFLVGPNCCFTLFKCLSCLKLFQVFFIFIFFFDAASFRK